MIKFDIDISISLKKYETRIVKALSYDFQFTTLKEQVFIYFDF